MTIPFPLLMTVQNAKLIESFPESPPAGRPRREPGRQTGCCRSPGPRRGRVGRNTVARVVEFGRIVGRKHQRPHCGRIRPAAAQPAAHVKGALLVLVASLRSICAHRHERHQRGSHCQHRADCRFGVDQRRGEEGLGPAGRDNAFGAGTGGLDQRLAVNSGPGKLERRVAEVEAGHLDAGDLSQAQFAPALATQLEGSLRAVDQQKRAAPRCSATAAVVKAR